MSQLMSPKKSIEISFVTPGSRGFSVSALLFNLDHIIYILYYDIYTVKTCISVVHNLQMLPIDGAKYY